MAKINEERIAYKNAEEKAERLLEYLQKYKRMFPKGVFDYATIENSLSGEAFENVILLRSRVVEYSSLVCELYGKYLLLAGGKTWNDAKKAGHNINNLYNALEEDERNQLDMFILKAYKKLGGDLGSLENLSMQAESVNNFVNYSDSISHTINISKSYKTKTSPVETLFNYMMRKIMGNESDFENETLKKSAFDGKNHEVYISSYPIANKKNSYDDHAINAVVTHSSSKHIEETYDLEDIPNTLSGIFSGKGQPLGVRARYTQDLLKDISNEEIMFLVSMAYGLIEYSQKVYEASKQAQSNGK